MRFLFIIFIGFQSVAQEHKSDAHRISFQISKQFWAGGICCSSGTNYWISVVSEDPADFKKIHLDSVYIDGMVFSQNIQNEKSDKHSTFSFGVSYTRINQHDQLTDPDKISVPPAREKMIVYCIRGKKYLYPITEVSELHYLAYP